MNQELKRPSIIAGTVLVAVFVLMEYVFQGSIDSISPYAIYIAELLFVLCSWFTLRNFEFLKKKQFTITSALPFLLLAAFGWVTHVVLVALLKVAVPFDFHSSETLLFLLLLGPVLEELLFRGALISIFKSFRLPTALLVLLSATCFSYSHYKVITTVPETFHLFIYAQTLYTFLLGAICAFIYLRRGLVFSVLGHLLFNFGFWLYLYS